MTQYVITADTCKITTLKMHTNLQKIFNLVGLTVETDVISGRMYIDVA